MRLLVTGGAGFIGSRLAVHAVKDGHQVLVVDKLTYAGHLSSLKAIEADAGFSFLHADICDEAAMRAAIEGFAPGAIIHLAAESHVDRSITGSDVFVETNVVGTFRLLQAAREYWESLPAERRASFRFLHVSTDEVFGSLGNTGRFNEETRYDPRSPYSASKAASDHLASAWFHTYGLPVVISNCSNNYGPYQLPEKLIPLMILNALEGRRLPVYGDGCNVRDWLYVDDHVRALLILAGAGRAGERYAIGGSCERTNLEVVETICESLDRLEPGSSPRRELISFVEDRPGHDRRYAIDAAKIRSELGWAPEETFDSGLKSTVGWYMANEWWWRPLLQAGQGVMRLGL